MAVADIEEGEELFFIPHSLVMCVRNSDLKDKIGPELEQLDHWLQIVLVLIYEFCIGPVSRWEPYWGVLPLNFNTLVWWKEKELAELKGCAVLDKIGAEAADKIFEEKLLPLVTRHNDFFTPHTDKFLGPCAKEILVGLAHQMSTLVMAYAFDISPEDGPAVDEGGSDYDDDFGGDPPKGMVPLADMLNADGERNNVSVFLSPFFNCLPSDRHKCNIPKKVWS